MLIEKYFPHPNTFNQACLYTRFILQYQKKSIVASMN